ncbi:T9SS type A sorting domain-containing protein, partial [Aquimarina algicola]
NVDPSNSDRVIITFSNYGIPSVFITEDAGETWTNISGNLEENADGSGNGPSVRSTAFLGGSHGTFGSRLQKIYAATSTGLYYTNRLNGERTVWVKEQFAIGNSVTDEVATRKDGFIAVAAHGNGMFSARFPIFSPLPEPTLSVAFGLDNFEVNENSEDTKFDIDGLFVHSEGRPIEIEVVNDNPELVSATIEGDSLKLSYARDLIGSASIGLIATSGEEQVSEGFTVEVLETPIYVQDNAQTSIKLSQNLLDFPGLVQSADDFTIPAGNTWNINRILAFGISLGSPSFTSVTVKIFEDNAGLPGEEVYDSGVIAPVSNPGDANLDIEFPEVLTLESGSYWISVYANLAFRPNGTLWFWSSQENVVGEETRFRDTVNFFGLGVTDWIPNSQFFIEDPIDHKFQIFGDIISLGSSVENRELVTLDAIKGASVYPNPSRGQFVFNFGDDLSKSNGKVTVNIFNSTGNLVRTDADVSMSNGLVWDASNLPSGFYYVKISGDVSGVFKLAKN